MIERMSEKKMGELRMEKGQSNKILTFFFISLANANKFSSALFHLRLSLLTFIHRQWALLLKVTAFSSSFN